MPRPPAGLRRRGGHVLAAQPCRCVAMCALPALHLSFANEPARPAQCSEDNAARLTTPLLLHAKMTTTVAMLGLWPKLAVAISQALAYLVRHNVIRCHLIRKKKCMETATLTIPRRPRPRGTLCLQAGPCSQCLRFAPDGPRILGTRRWVRLAAGVEFII